MKLLKEEEKKFSLDKIRLKKIPKNSKNYIK